MSGGRERAWGGRASASEGVKPHRIPGTRVDGCRWCESHGRESEAGALRVSCNATAACSGRTAGRRLSPALRPEPCSESTHPGGCPGSAGHVKTCRSRSLPKRSRAGWATDLPPWIEVPGTGRHQFPEEGSVASPEQQMLLETPLERQPASLASCRVRIADELRGSTFCRVFSGGGGTRLSPSR